MFEGRQKAKWGVKARAGLSQWTQGEGSKPNRLVRKPELVQQVQSSSATKHFNTRREPYRALFKAWCLESQEQYTPDDFDLRQPDSGTVQVQATDLLKRGIDRRDDGDGSLVHPRAVDPRL